MRPVTGLGGPRTVAEARHIQEQLRSRVRSGPGPRRVDLVAGADLAYRRDGSVAWAAVVLWSIAAARVVEAVSVRGRPGFPYVPGYLSFREGPLLLRAFARLRRRPDLCVFDGQGIAHPRGLGLASHMGVLLDLPSVGCAKSRLVGEGPEPGRRRGDWTRLCLDGRVVGAILRTRDGVRPVYVSPGHRMDVAGSVRAVLALTTYRVPEPIRRAEQAVNRRKRAAASA